MENPAIDISRIVHMLAVVNSPDIQQNTIRKYFTNDASFRHPLCSVESAPNSREGILGLYQWYRVLSKNIELSIDNITYDFEKSTLFLDISEVFHLKYSPFQPVRVRLLTRLILREEGGRYYITCQEDFFHPDDLLATFVPPLAQFVGCSLRISGFAYGLSARLAQAAFGVWRPHLGN